MPDDSVLEASLLVPSRSIGFVELGQLVKIRYEAFPYQRYGIYQGSIKSITNNIISPNELPNMVANQEPAYKITVTLNKQQIEGYGKQWPLQAGMLLEADVVLERYSLWRWLLDPVFSLKGKLL